MRARRPIKTKRLKPIAITRAKLVVKPVAKKSSSSLDIREFTGAHKGETMFIVGNGPTIKKQDLSLLDGRPVIGCNEVWKTYKTKYAIAADPIPQKLNHADQSMIHFYGINKGHPAPPAHVYRFNRSSRVTDFGPRYNGKLYIANSVIFSASHLAYIMGAKTIVYLGIPMCFVDGYYHAHDKKETFDKYIGVKNRHTLIKSGDFYTTRYWINQKTGLIQLQDKLRTVGVKCIDATEGGQVKLKINMTLSEAVKL